MNDNGKVSRRGLVRGAAAGALVAATPGGERVVGAAGVELVKPAGPGQMPPLNRFSRMVQEHFVTKVRAIEAARVEPKTKDEAERYVATVREKIQQCFGPFPDRTPLNAKVTGVLDRDGYRVEKVIFESRPGFLVTANLYLPKKAGKVPGVVGTCGHSDNGKAYAGYQSFAQGLARMGYACLIFDPLGQGERLQYVDEALKPKYGIGVSEHLIAGNQQLLVGEFIGGWRAWDGIRALDYLLSRPEVDPAHVGVTGNSGGGTMTTWLCGLESRWTMAAPSCFVTTFRRNLENELPADTEQCPPRALALGLDHSDFLAVMAPKPVVILAQEKDYFDVRGATEAYERLKRLYKLLGHEDNVSLFVGPKPHGYTQESREAMYRWFNRATRVSDAQTEPVLTLEKDEDLWCTPKGQVAGVGSKPVHVFTAEKAGALAAKRERLSGEKLRAALVDLLKLPERKATPDDRHLLPPRSRGYPKRFASTYAVETEPGIHALVYRLADESLSSRPTQNAGRAILYVGHHSADAELREEPLVRELMRAEPESTVYACDVRGVGESKPDTCGENSFLKPYGCDYFYAIHSVMLDRPYVGQKTHDLLAVLDWLEAQGHTEAHLAAKGWGALPATFAAVLSSFVKRVTLKDALASYRSIAEAERYDLPLSALVPNVLSTFDLPDCYEELKAKDLRM
jgi:dienelactone hydrolase